MLIYSPNPHVTSIPNISHKWLNTRISLVIRNLLPSKGLCSVSSHRVVQGLPHGVEFCLPVTSTSCFWLATLEPLVQMLFTLGKHLSYEAGSSVFKASLSSSFYMQFLLQYALGNIHHLEGNPWPLTLSSGCPDCISYAFSYQWPKDTSP